MCDLFYVFASEGGTAENKDFGKNKDFSIDIHEILK